MTSHSRLLVTFVADVGMIDGDRLARFFCAVHWDVTLAVCRLLGLASGVVAVGQVRFVPGR